MSRGEKFAVKVVLYYVPSGARRPFGVPPLSGGRDGYPGGEAVIRRDVEDINAMELPLRYSVVPEGETAGNYAERAVGALDRRVGGIFDSVDEVSSEELCRALVELLRAGADYYIFRLCAHVAVAVKVVRNRIAENRAPLRRCAAKEQGAALRHHLSYSGKPHAVFKITFAVISLRLRKIYRTVWGVYRFSGGYGLNIRDEIAAPRPRRYISLVAEGRVCALDGYDADAEAVGTAAL